MIKTLNARVVLKNDSSENWEKTKNFVPLKGEVILYDDDNDMRFKVGNGTVVDGTITGTKVSELPFVGETTWEDIP